MIFRRCFLFLLFGVSVCLGQDTIRGTYSYTYGDRESLVEARQACKDLAIREAIESYYVFVESSTDVENFQLKEDMIQSIAAGYLRDIRVVDQVEEGRTITMTVEATVMPDEVKEIVEKLVSSQRESTASTDDASSREKKAVEEEESPFWVALSEYEGRMASTEQAWGKDRFDSALSQIQEMQTLLEKRKPSKDRPFQWLMYKSVKTHTMLIHNLIRVEYFESQRKPVRARANMKLVLDKSAELRNYLARLEKLSGLNDKQQAMRDGVVARCRTTLERAKKKAVAYGR